jgi:hypothetical protein
MTLLLGLGLIMLGFCLGVFCMVLVRANGREP